MRKSHAVERSFQLLHSGLAEHLLRERATIHRIKARRLLLPDLAHNDAPTVPDSAATRDSTAALAAAQKRLDTMSTGRLQRQLPRGECMSMMTGRHGLENRDNE